MNKYFKIIIVAIATILWIWAFIVEPYFIIVDENVVIKVPQWDKNLDGLKIVAAGDFHIRPGKHEEKRLARIVDEINRQNPDIILLLGDYINADSIKTIASNNALTRELSRLSSKYGVYAVLGNHDTYYSRRNIRKIFNNANISLLENSNEKISTPKGDFYIAGIPDAYTCSYSYKNAFKNIPDNVPVIFLTHTPDVLREVPDKASISFSGHTHGGQVKLPFYGAVIANTKHGRKHSEGLISKGEKGLFINRGLGMSRIPIRFLCPPTISIITLYKGDLNDSNPKPKEIIK